MDPATPVPVYGSPLLDELHTLFPEILYDNTIFPNSESNHMLGWIRHRMNYMFPQSFRRARLLYSANEAEQRRRDHEDWVFLSRVEAPRAPVQMIMRDYPGFEARNTIFPNHVLQQPPPRQNPTLNSLINLLERTEHPQQALRFEMPETRLRAIPLAGARSPTLEWLSLFFDTSVPVGVGAAQLQTNTEVLQASSVSGEIICAVCQHHDVEVTTPGGTEADSQWRRLRGCGHLFHRACVDVWLERNPRCPVCRADIRNPVTQQMPPGPHIAESVAESVLSNPPP